MKIKRTLATILATYLTGHAAHAKAVFAHYMVGTVNPGSGHAELDIDQAIAVGFDAFALNVGQPNQPWAQSTVSQLFNYATSKNFKLFFSIDLFQYENINDFTTMVNQYLGHSAYYHAGPNNRPFLSTYGSGRLGPSDVAQFKSKLSQSVFFIPDFDSVNNFYNDPSGWLNTWGSVVDGGFGWETAWPSRQDTPANISVVQDNWVSTNIVPQGKSYMISLSPFQYKHLPPSNTHYYRVGEVNMPQRMQQILTMPKIPDFVEFITWNDAGEGHYVGNLWSEGIPDYILSYANQDSWDHSGWQSLVASFIAAYKKGGSASSMVPVGKWSTATAAGSMWYRTILKNAACNGDPLRKPEGWQAALDAINVAIVLPGSGYKLRVTSGGQVIQTLSLVSGLNYASVPGVKTGAQKVELLNPSGGVAMAASGRVDVAADTSGICNFNYQVAAFA